MRISFLSKMMAALLFGVTSLAFAMEPGQEVTLKQIMQGLGDDVAVIADGMFTDDMDRVARGAAGIAHHAPIPSEQVQLIIAELGSEMPAFKQFDKHVHDLSLSIVSAAEAQDLKRVSTGFRQLVDGCLACHVSYKARVAGILEKP